MTENALGLIETVGLPAAIEAADAAMKAANVRLVGYEKTRGGGLVIVKIRGDVGAVRAAVEAAVVAASKVGKIYGSHVIPRPHDESEQLIGAADRGPAAQEAAPQPPTPQPPSSGKAAPKAPKPVPPRRVAKAAGPASAALPAEPASEPPAEARDAGGVAPEA